MARIGHWFPYKTPTTLNPSPFSSIPIDKPTYTRKKYFIGHELQRHKDYCHRLALLFIAPASPSHCSRSPWWVISCLSPWFFFCRDQICIDDPLAKWRFAELLVTVYVPAVMPVFRAKDGLNVVGEDAGKAGGASRPIRTVEMRGAVRKHRWDELHDMLRRDYAYQLPCARQQAGPQRRAAAGGGWALA